MKNKNERPMWILNSEADTDYREIMELEATDYPT